MITRLWPLTLLVAQLALGFDHSIDLTRCKKAAKDTACFVRKSCIKDETEDGVLEQLIDQTLKEEGKCDAVLQTKMLIRYKLHVMMEIKLSGSNKIKIDDGVKIVQGTDQFICKPGLVDCPKEFICETIGRQIFEDQHLFCSFYAKFKDETRNPTSINPNNDAAPQLVFIKDGTKDEMDFNEAHDAMWKEMDLWTCNHNLVSSLKKDSTTDASMILTEVDTTLMTHEKCDHSFVVVQKTGDIRIDTSKVACEKPNAKYIWRYEESNAMKNIEGDFQVFCPQKKCLRCDKKPLQPDTCTGCKETSFLPASQDGETCPTLTCDTGRFTVTGDAQLEGAAECKKSVAKSAEYAWFVGDTELTTAACLVKIERNCFDKYTPLSPKTSYPMVYNGRWEGIEGLGTNTLSCKDKGESLRIFPEIYGLMKTLECNLATGYFVSHNGTDIVDKSFGVECVIPGQENESPKSAGLWDHPIALGLIIGCSILIVLFLLAGYCWFLKGKKKKAAAVASSKKQVSANKTAEKINSKSASSAASGAPGDAVDTSEGKKKSSRKSKRSKRDSKKSKRDKKLKLDDHMTWDNEMFTKKILPNFKSCDADAKAKWLRDTLCRFYAYSNTKKIPESGTFNQFWLLVKQCADDKCEDAGVWVELFNICFLIGYSIGDKNEHTDSLRGHYMKPLENYMLEYLKKCDIYKRKDEPRPETEMRVICIMVLLHTRHPDVTETLRKLTYNEKLEVPLRMLTAACYTRERDDKGKTVQAQYKRVIDTSVLDPHTSEGWGTYLQHCAFGLGGYLITQTETFQFQFFDAIYQFPLQKDPTADRIFSPSDWLYAYKGALMHENSAKIGLDIFKKMNNGCLLHIDTLLKQKHKDDVDEMEKHRDQYKKDMKEYTQLLSELLIGEEEFNDFKPHLHFVLLFIGDHAKNGEPLSEDRIRERAINMQNMLRDRNFAKECVESLKAIGAKDV